MSELTAEQQVVEGLAWDEFCEQLRRTGQQILRPEAPTDAFTRAEGFRYLTRLLRIGLDMYVECNDPEFPVFYRPSHETAKIGADNPDNYYQRAQIDGRYQYRISGTRGTVAYLGFVTLSGGYGEDGRNASTGSLDSGGGLEVNDDGTLEVILSQQRPAAGNWLPISAASNTVLVRQTFLDRSRESLAELRIERLDASARPQPLTASKFATNLKSCANFVEGTARLFADWSQSYLPLPNELPPADQAVCQAAGGDPNIFYYHSYFNLHAGEALLVELDRIPKCENWNLQVDNYWMESLDYRYHTIHVNKHTAVYRGDGGVTLVICDTDPGVPNWLETAGHRQGTLCFRWIGSSEIIHPATRVVRISDIAEPLV